MVNCNHKLPSGKTVMERFSLNRKSKPIIFMTAPWFGGRAKQATGGGLKDIKALSKFVDSSLAPRAKEINTDRDLAKYCGWGKSSITHDDKSIGTSCIVFVVSGMPKPTQTSRRDHSRIPASALCEFGCE